MARRVPGRDDEHQQHFLSVLWYRDLQSLFVHYKTWNTTAKSFNSYFSKVLAKMCTFKAETSLSLGWPNYALVVKWSAKTYCFYDGRYSRWHGKWQTPWLNGWHTADLPSELIFCYHRAQPSNNNEGMRDIVGTVYQKPAKVCKVPASVTVRWCMKELENLLWPKLILSFVLKVYDRQFKNAKDASPVLLTTSSASEQK